MKEKNLKKNKIVLILFILFIDGVIGSFLWRHWGNTQAGGFYSPIQQINKENVQNLTLTWTFTNVTLEEGTSEEATPIITEDGNGGFVFVYCTGNSVPYALDPITGKLRWSVNKTSSSPYYQGGGTCRGVESWENPDLSNGDLCRVTIFYGTLDMRLIAVDGATGQFCPQFGVNGQINLCKYIPKCKNKIDGSLVMGVTSPPIVVRNNVIVGNAIADSVEQNIASGVVLSFSAYNGSFSWQFSPIPHNQSDPAYSTYKNGTERVGGGNVWSLMSADELYGIVYLPTTSPSVDQYGGARIGSNLYSNSIVALNATNGNVIWYFQTVHHNLWDYDNPAQPTIMNISIPFNNSFNSERRVIVFPTKMGFIFVFDALTGEEVFEIEEIPVPFQSDVPGEVPYPTQPFPMYGNFGNLIPLQFSNENIFSNSTDDFTDCLNLYNQLEGVQQGKIFTPPSLNGFLLYPLKTGVINYGGISVDETRQLIAFKMKNLAFAGVIFPGDEEAPSWCGDKPVVINRMIGTPYSVCFTKFQANSGVPCVKPPFSSLVVIDIGTGLIKWSEPFGYTEGFDPLWGSVGGSVGGQLITKSGLLFAAGSDDLNLWAFDVENGEKLWRFPLPGKAEGSPIGYSLNGQEFISIAVQGNVYTFSLL